MSFGEKYNAMSKGGQILATILNEIQNWVRPGVLTSEIDDYARRLCLKYKVRPSFQGYDGYPAAICVSVNDEVVHGIPGKRMIQEGDIVSLDFGVYLDGYHTDSAISFGVGNINLEKKKLLEVTLNSLLLGIEQAVVGNKIGDIGHAIQKYVEQNGFGVVRTLVGHSIGKKLHEEPMIPNFGSKSTGELIKEGMTLAIEPMVTAGQYPVYQASDGWTFLTKDSSDSAHFEHTIFVTDSLPIILTEQKKQF